MDSQFHQALRMLCSNTGWNYAVFWKLEHRARMMLTWEDAYCDNQEQHDLSENNQSGDIVGNWCNGRYSHDSLALALAKMSYHVYSLGEGIVGQVAVTGEHLWISADTKVTGSCSSFECCDGWETQLSAGIRTIAVVAVVPHGVVQLGSLNKMAEDLKQVKLIREIFFELQDHSMGYIPTPCTDSFSCLSDLSTRGSQTGAFLDCTDNVDRTHRSIEKNMKEFPSFQKSIPHSTVPLLPGAYPKKTVEVIINKRAGPEYPISGNTISLWDVGPGSEYNDTTLSNDQNGVLFVPEPSNLEGPKDLEKKFTLRTETNHMHHLNTSFRFSAGCELYEALGPAFIEQNTCADWEKEKRETAIEMPVEGTSSSDLVMTNPSSEHLLEAVVANVCHSGNDFNNANLICKSVKSPLITENVFEPSLCSTGFSFDCSSLVEEDTLHRLNSSTSPSKCSEQSDKPKELAKINKKRGRPGENCRPRPRDRQLIQDRIKELRDLVPNGSKCSIDSLLERTIKHMLFMQCIIKHTDKLDKCTDLKLLDKETSIGGSSSYEQGSSWAMEVGSHRKVCPIKVENINMNGQMQVELLCEDCNHFLGITDAIRSLGLTILKGITKAYKEKTWICFVVEGQNNKSLHRMEILWSLVQILQSKMES